MISGSTTIGYLSLAEMKGMFPTAVIGKSDASILGALDWAEALINLCTGDYFAAKSLVLYLNGTGSSGLYFKEDASGLALLTITSIVDRDSGETYSTDCYQKYAHHIMMRETPNIRAAAFLQATWPRGIANIILTGTFGWTSTPSLIKRATGLLASAMLTASSDEVSVISGEALSSERIGSYSYSVSGIAKSVMESRVTGLPEVDSILDMFAVDDVAISATASGDFT